VREELPPSVKELPQKLVGTYVTDVHPNGSPQISVSTPQLVKSGKINS